MKGCISCKEAMRQCMDTHTFAFAHLYNDEKENYPDLNEKQISEQLDFDPSTIRRYKREKELLTSLREKDMEK